MLESKRDLIGSPYNDQMKWLRKQDPGNSKCYAADLDICLVSFDPPGVIAIIDYKRNGEEITRTEKILYRSMAYMGLPIYIVTLDQERYFVSQYHPDADTFTNVLFDATEEGYWEWEKQLRKSWTSLQKSRDWKYSRPKGSWRGVISTNEQPQA